MFEVSTVNKMKGGGSIYHWSGKKSKRWALVAHYLLKSLICLFVLANKGTFIKYPGYQIPGALGISWEISGGRAN